MATKVVNLKNISGGDYFTIDPDHAGALANGSSRNVELTYLLASIDGDYLDHLSAAITAGSLEVRYGGLLLSAAEVERLYDVVAAAATLDAPPMLDRLDVATGAAMAAAGGDIKLVGRNLLQGQTFDSKLLVEGAASLAVYALKPGDSGISAEMTVGVGGLVVTYAAKKLTIELAAAGSTDDAIATEINKNGGVAEGVLRATSAAGGTFTAAQAEAPLTGGVGDYDGNRVEANGGEALPANEPGTTTTAKWSDTGITCTTPGGGAATDVATVAVKSNGVWTQQLSAVLV